MRVDMRAAYLHTARIAFDAGCRAAVVAGCLRYLPDDYAMIRRRFAAPPPATPFTPLRYAFALDAAPCYYATLITLDAGELRR